MTICKRCHSQVPDGMAFCPICGQQVIDLQQNQPSQDQTAYKPASQQQGYQQPPPRQGYQQQPQQQGYQQPPQRPAQRMAPQQNYSEQQKSNAGLWTVIGILAFLVLAGGGWLLYDKVLKKEKSPEVTQTTTVQQPKEAEAKSASAAAKKKETVKETPKKTVERSQPVQQQTVVPQQSNYGSYFSLSGLLNGDDVEFRLNRTSGNYVTGKFYNYTVGVTWEVSGTFTDSYFNLRTTGKKNWSFSANNNGYEFVGKSTNGTVTYDMAVR